MIKKCILVIISAICVAALSACAATPIQTASQVQTASPVPSQASVPPAAQSPSATEATPSVSVSPSASPDASVSASSDDLGITLENIIKEDSLNKNYQNFMKVPGETIEATIQGNTLTFNVTLDKNIKPADFTADMQAKYKQDLQNQIDVLAEEYDGLIDCTFIYNLMNKSGDKLMSITQDYKAQL